MPDRDRLKIPSSAPERQEQELSQLRVRVKAFLARAHAGEEDFRFIEPVVEDEEIEIELVRRRQRRGEKEAS